VNAEKTVDQLQKELEMANKELASLTYSISHDLRSPLQVIDGFSEALAEEYRDKLDEQGRDYLQRIRGAAARMENLIENLLELARVTRTEIRHERIDVSEVAQSIADELIRSEPARNVRFSIEAGLTVEGDPHLVRVALEHLLRNSWKFTSKHPAALIEVGTEEKEGRRLFFVRDDGAGFDPTYVSKMFGAFQRLHSASEFKGTGIGLAMVRRIVRRHGGDVWAVGQVEKGATVYIDWNE